MPPAPIAKQAYGKWLGARPSTAALAAKWKALPGVTPAQRLAAKNMYTGYAGATDPAYGGSPLSVPSDSSIIWSGKNVPNLASLAAGGGSGYTMLTPVSRGRQGGFDVYGVPKDMTPQWGKDYLNFINTQEQGALNYAKTSVQPWVANVLGGAQSENTAAQTGLANLMSTVGTNIQNAATGISQPAANAQTGGLAAAPTAYHDQGGDQALRQLQNINIGTTAYQAALGTGGVKSAADALTGATAQSIMRIPNEYDKQRADFTTKLGQLTDQLKENQLAREQTRQQQLESRREFGLTLDETRRQNLRQIQLQQDILGQKTTQADKDRAARLQAIREQQRGANARTAATIAAEGQRTQAQIDAANARFNARLKADQGITRKDLITAGAYGNWPSKPKNTPVGTRLIQSDDGRWYAMPLKGTKGAGGDTETNVAYQKRYRDYVGGLPQQISGKKVRVKIGTDANGNPQYALRPDPNSQAQSIPDIARDMVHIQNFSPSDTWKALSPHLKQPEGVDTNSRAYKQWYHDSSRVIQLLDKNMSGTKLSRLQTLSKMTGYPQRDIAVVLGLPPPRIQGPGKSYHRLTP